MAPEQRRLAAVMFTDMVGYTALGQRDESLSLALVEEQRRLVRPILSKHNGREVKTMGDAFLVEFPNALDAVRCAYDIQRAIRELNFSLSADRRLHLRIGVHLGDVVESEGDVSGDAVNIASRIEPLAEDGGVCITRQVYDQVKGKFELPQSSLGAKTLKNLSEPLEVYKIVMPWEERGSQRENALAPTLDRIAILPFRNMSPDPNDEYFAEGITEEIISTVAGIRGLSVISRTSVMGYKGTTKKIREIGRELEVGSVLEGSFRKSGNKIRVTTQLIDVASDRHLWAQNYDRNLDDVFEVQSDVAKQVADTLKVKILTPEMERLEKRPTDSTTAYTLYLKGRNLWSRRGIDNANKGAECFEQALRLDQNFALGYSGLADCHLLLANWGEDPSANMEKSRSLLNKALELDGDLAEAHASKGLLLEQGDHEWEEAEREFKRAIELKPGYATVHQWYGYLLRLRSRWDEGLAEINKALELDPLSPIINYNFSLFYFQRRDYSRALELLKRVAELDPKFPVVHFVMMDVYGRAKMFEDMQREADIGVQLLTSSFPAANLMADAWMAIHRGDGLTLGNLLPQLVAKSADGVSLFTIIARIHFTLGDKDEGFEWLEKAYSQRVDLVDLSYDPNWDDVRDDPRFRDLLERLGLGDSLPKVA